MDDPEPLTAAELANWLKYYRALGFTHLYRRRPPQTGSLDGGEALPLPAAGAPTDSLQPSPPANQLYLGAALPTAASTRDAAPRKSAEEQALPAFSAPPASRAGTLFDSVAPRETLEQIREDLGDCRRCKLWKGRKTIVFGSGNPKAELLFVGEGPGADEDEQGLPFVGRAGQLLTQMIEKGLKIPRPDVYICNIIKCRPPENRKPEKDEIAACRQFVERQIDAVRPRVIVVLGATAVETLLGRNQSMGSLRGQWHEFHGIPLLVTYHPAFLLRDPNRKPEAWADLKKVLAFLQAPPTQPASD
ncbi:MAG: uracil-DNA glycosylase family protein [Terriglobia bacterium]